MIYSHREMLFSNMFNLTTCNTFSKLVIKFVRVFGRKQASTMTLRSSFAHKWQGTFLQFLQNRKQPDTCKWKKKSNHKVMCTCMHMCTHIFKSVCVVCVCICFTLKHLSPVITLCMTRYCIDMRWCMWTKIHSESNCILSLEISFQRKFISIQPSSLCPRPHL